MVRARPIWAIFCHWGLFTGRRKFRQRTTKPPFRYETVADFEAAAKDPRL